MTLYLRKTLQVESIFSEAFSVLMQSNHTFIIM